MRYTNMSAEIKFKLLLLLCFLSERSLVAAFPAEFTNSLVDDLSDASEPYERILYSIEPTSDTYLDSDSTDQRLPSLNRIQIHKAPFIIFDNPPISEDESVFVTDDSPLQYIPDDSFDSWNDDSQDISSLYLSRQKRQTPALYGSSYRRRYRPIVFPPKDQNLKNRRFRPVSKVTSGSRRYNFKPISVQRSSPSYSGHVQKSTRNTFKRTTGHDSKPITFGRRPTTTGHRFRPFGIRKHTPSFSGHSLKSGVSYVYKDMNQKPYLYKVDHSNKIPEDKTIYPSINKGHEEVEVIGAIRPPDLSRDTRVNPDGSGSQQGITLVEPEAEVFDLSLVIKEMESRAANGY